ILSSGNCVTIFLRKLIRDLAEILSLCEEAPRIRKLPGAKGSGSQLSVVAGACNQRYLHLDHAIL
ncbi:MAG: hypothetical protein V3V97_21980, partial [Hyphomicrobiaceae bacterium]